MNKPAANVLIAAATGYTLIVAFMVVFTLGFFGVSGVTNDLVGFCTFWLIALSPLATWFYCLKRAAAWRRGERPPF